MIAAGAGGDGEPPLPEPDGGAAGVPLHHPRQADAALVPRAARLQHHGTQHNISADMRVEFCNVRQCCSILG